MSTLMGDALSGTLTDRNGIYIRRVSAGERKIEGGVGFYLHDRAELVIEDWKDVEIAFVREGG